MAIVVQCPSCGVSSPAADSLSGRNVRCKKCGNPFVAQPTLDGIPSDTQKSKPLGTADPFPQLPAEFGRYRVLKLLGKGGMGAVYLAKDSQLGREVALKIPFFDAKESPQRAERFVREARSAAALQHPNVCTVFDAGRINGTPFLTMGFIRGTPLDKAIDPDAPMPQTRAAEIARKVALGLAHAHGKGIVHRDLKPANVMLDEGGEPVVMDFGLAKRGAGAEPSEAKRSRNGDDAPQDAKLTRDGGVLGTPSYMSPEQVRGDADVGPASDVYSLGVLLFELVTGRTPYSGNMGAVMGKILAAPVPPLAETRPDADPRLDAICQRAMAKFPAARFGSMTEMAAALGEYLTATASPTVSVELVEPAAPRVIVPAPAYRPAPFEDLAEAGEEDAEPAARKPRRKSKKPVKAASRRPLWIGLGVLGLLAAVAGIVLMTVRTKYGDVVIELSDPAAKVDVVVDGTRIDLTGLDKPLTLTAGEHGLAVTGADFETVTQSFTVKKGEKEVVKVTLRPKAVLAKNDPPKPVEPPEPKNPDPQPPTDPKPPTLPISVASDGFVPLFNGKDLTGWTSTAGANGKWQVSGGAVTVTGPTDYLYTDRSDYEDFHLRVEAKINAAGNSGIYFRSRKPVVANRTSFGHYEAQISTRDDQPKTGSLFAMVLVKADEVLAPPDTWFTYEVIAKGPRIQLKVNGKQTAEYTETKPDALKKGHIALQCWKHADGETVATFRNIEIKELPSEKPPEPKLPPKKAEFVPLFNGKDLTGWTTKAGLPVTGSWEVKNGAIVRRLIDKPSEDLWSENQYGDMVLELEFKAEGNSGVWIRKDPKAGPNAVEIQIHQPGRPIGLESLGAFCYFKAPTRDNAKKDEWNALRLTAVGPRLTLEINGDVVNEMDVDKWDQLKSNPDGTTSVGRPGFDFTIPPKKFPRRGYVVLQAHAGQVAYRNIRVKPLEQDKGAVVPQPKAELVKLAELPQGQDKALPSLADEGKTLYWLCITSPRGCGQIWRATRKSVADPFQDARQVIDAGDTCWNMTVTEADDFAVFSRLDGGGAAGSARYTTYVARRQPGARKLDSPVSVPGLGTMQKPSVSADGSVIVALQALPGQSLVNILVTSRRSKPADVTAWEKPEPLPLKDMPAGTWTWGTVTLSPDRKYLFGHIRRVDDASVGRRTVVLKLLDDGKTYGEPRTIPLSPDLDVGGCPTFVPSTRELFLSGTDKKGVTDLYVLRNFDPERDTEPLK